VLSFTVDISLLDKNSKLASHKKTLSGKIKRLSLVDKMAYSTLGSGSVHSEHFNKPEMEVASLETFQKILDSTDLDLKEFSDDMAYLGFDKNKIAKLAAKQLGALRTVKFCMLGGMRGTNIGKIISKSVKLDDDIKWCWENKRILANGTGPEDLTLGRLLAVFPEITAYYLWKHKVPKKLVECTCPASLQFPAAAGLPMSNTVRMFHLEFAVKFSFLISKDKKFHPQYYRAAFTGQQDTRRLSPAVAKEVGNPTVDESTSFDLDTAFLAMMEKYGKERFIPESQSP